MQVTGANIHTWEKKLNSLYNHADCEKNSSNLYNVGSTYIAFLNCQNYTNIENIFCCQWLSQRGLGEKGVEFSKNMKGPCGCGEYFAS
jgi:hypothetical protein